eukprot:7888341-Alexandrium_andersonii.AAC.1
MSAPSALHRQRIPRNQGRVWIAQLPHHACAFRSLEVATGLQPSTAQCKCSPELSRALESSLEL